MGKTSQRKGRDGELELCSRLREHGFDVKPGEAVSFGEVPDLTGLDGIHVEVKRCEKLALTSWLEQSRKDSERFRDGLPAVFHRRNRQDWLVTMTLSDWSKLYKDTFMYNIGDMNADFEEVNLDIY